MNHKVLLADDSLTIQKVIKITLASQPYDITDCSTEDDLFAKVPQLQPKIVFLDFNLSEKYTGYDLTAKIKSLSPNTKVLLLLGTFDTVDDAAMEKCGASDKIVKPFDSNKFIAICRQLIETFPEDDGAPVAVAESKPAPAPAAEDQWQMSHTTTPIPAPIETKPLDSSFPADLNPLTQEMHSWGMTVPGVINETTSSEIVVELPPVIAESSAKPTAQQVAAAPQAEPTKSHDIKFPETSDLDYPTLEELTIEKTSEPVTNSNVLNLNNNSGFELELESNFVENSSGDVKNIEAQIHDEVAGNLWQVDEFEDLKREVSSKLEEVKSNFQPTINDFDESLFKPLDESDTIQWQENDTLSKSEPTKKSAPMASMDELRGEIDELVKKHVKEYLDQMFQKSVEKVSWEVIPDLAENIIRQELSKISHRILNE